MFENESAEERKTEVMNLIWRFTGRLRREDVGIIERGGKEHVVVLDKAVSRIAGEIVAAGLD